MSEAATVSARVISGVAYLGAAGSYVSGWMG